MKTRAMQIGTLILLGLSGPARADEPPTPRVPDARPNAATPVTRAVQNESPARVVSKRLVRDGNTDYVEERTMDAHGITSIAIRPRKPGENVSTTALEPVVAKPAATPSPMPSSLLKAFRQFFETPASAEN